MKLSLNWLRELVDVDLPVPALARRLIDATAEVESWQTVGGDWDPALIRVAEVVAVEPHPNADRLRLATVETGHGRQQVVCGAPNVAVGQKVAFATEGAMLIDGHTGERAKLKLRPIRGVESAGMVLSEKELGLSGEHEGILVLDPAAPVGRPLVEQLGDVVFDISTWANRADLLGVLGLAREVAALTGATLREPARTYAASGPQVETLVSVAIEAPDLCRRFTASVIEGVTVGPSPAWMQDRLLKHGMRPINNVVDITNYVMIETGQPLHAFDYDLVRGHRIVARRAAPGEHLVTLDGVDRALDPEMLVICDGGGPVGVAGVMGGGNSEVSERTRTVLLEVANFKPGSIRRTSGLLKLRSEASLRFEKGIGPEMAEYAQHRALHLFEQITGGRVAQGLIDLFPAKTAPREIALPVARIEQVLGLAIPAPEAARILTALGFECAPAGEQQLLVQPPYWRPDVEIADDIVEDIARIHGYDRLPATMLRGALPAVEERPVELVRERVRDLAVALGYQETITYTLTERETLARVVAPGDNERNNPLSVLNPVSARHTYLRTSLRAGVLQAYAANSRQGAGALRVFEIGTEYLPVEADLPRERPVVCAALGGSAPVRGRLPAESVDFFDAKGDAEAIGRALGIALTAAPASHFGLLDGHTADLLAENTCVGVLGQVHPQTAAAFDLGEPVYLLELWLEELAAVIPERPAYTPPSRYPEVRQDVALLIDEATPAGQIAAIVRGHRSGKITVAGEVFDDYRGPGVPAGKKSLAVALRFGASDRTLTDEDVARVQNGLLRRLEKEAGATLRTA